MVHEHMSVALDFTCLAVRLLKLGQGGGVGGRRSGLEGFRSRVIGASGGGPNSTWQRRKCTPVGGHRGDFEPRALISDSGGPLLREGDETQNTGGGGMAKVEGLEERMGELSGRGELAGKVMKDDEKLVGGTSVWDNPPQGMLTAVDSA